MLSNCQVKHGQQNPGTHSLDLWEFGECTIQATKMYVEKSDVLFTHFNAQS